MAKIAIPVRNGSGSATLDSRFARAPYIAICDTDGNDMEFVQNPISVEHGAGPRMVQFLADKGVEALVVVNIGENALKAAKIAGIRVYRADDGAKLQDILAKFNSNELGEIH